MRRAIMLVGILLSFLVGNAQAYSSSADLDAVASWLAGREVSVRCLTEEESASDLVLIWGAAAYVEGWENSKGWHPFDYTVFSYGICEPLQALAEGDASGYSIEDLSWSILVITHESGHLRGHRWSGSEAKTQCWAMRHLRYVARRFGIEDPVALSLIVQYALEVHAGMDPEYQLTGCILPKP